jgi:2'-5' RNA ligase
LARPDTARLFFALWPDATARVHLARWATVLQRICGGRRTRDAQLHVTLAFLGDVPLARVGELRALAASLACPGFTLRFAAPGHWPRKRIAWAAPAPAPDGLAVVAARLGSGLDTIGLRMDDRPFFPHVTLLRDARCERLPEFEGFAWEVQDFVLVESKLGSAGSTYRVIGQWPLTGGRHPPSAAAANR